MPFLARGSQPFPPSVVTTLAQVPLRGQAPFVSLGRRGSPIRPVRLGPADTLEARFPPQGVPLASRRPLTPRTTTQVRLFKQLLDKRTGALLVRHQCPLHVLSERV